MNLNRKSRRQFLRNASGVAVAIPFFPSLAKTFGQTPAAGTSQPSPIIFATSRNGYLGNAMFPALSDRATAVSVGENILALNLPQLVQKGGNISQLLAPCNGFADQVTIVKGLFALSRSLGDHNGPQTLGGFIDKSSGGTPIWTDYPGNTVDFILASNIYGSSTPIYDLVKLDFENSGLNWSWAAGPNHPSLVLETASMSFAFAQLFGSLSTTGNNALLTERRLLVDQVLTQYKATRSLLSTSEQPVLDQHIESLFEIQTQMAMAPTACVKPTPPPADPTPPDLLTMGKIRNDLIVAAINCGLCSVFELDMGWSDALTSADPSILYGYHGVSHVQNPGDSGPLNKIIQVQTNILADLASKLKASINPTTGKDRLFESLILYSNEVGNMNGGDSETPDGFVYFTHVHLNSEILCVMLGSLGGKINSGNYIDFGQRTPNTIDGFSGHYFGRAHNNLLVSLLTAYGVSPSVYETGGLVGIGDYGGNTYSYTADQVYAGTDAQKRASLPYLFK